jgi:6-phosphofructokinase 1
MFKISTIGDAKIISPLKNLENDPRSENFASDEDRIIIDINLNNLLKNKDKIESLEAAGTREKIYFDPGKLKCAIATCGGLCPGLNDIIRAVVLELSFTYGVRNIFGVKYGLQGFIPKYKHEFVNLTPKVVADILEYGGSILGTSRGRQNIDEIVDSLSRENIGLLFMIGGDGTLMAASKIAENITRKKLNISVVGIPKTIDNDIYMVAKSFGFDTAVDIATQAIKGIHNEAKNHHNGIGLIKLMGRNSGFIAALATLAQQDVNFVLIPESDFDLDGDFGLLNLLEKRLNERKHAVIVAAEGAGRKFFENNSENIKENDIGLYLKYRINKYFKEKNIDVSLKYLDPSYMIRSLPANSNDRVFCSFLGRNAVHAGMAGKTKLVIGYLNNHFVHVPLDAITGKQKKINIKKNMWMNVLGATGQGALINV